MKIIFCLTAGRTGTKFLKNIFKNNVKNCIARHEPIPSMFGKPIYWYQKGQIDKIRELFNKKVKKINKKNPQVYIETNHAFLKSFSDVAMEYYPNMKLIHAVRNPLKMAKSGFNRYKQLRKYHYPYSYKGDNGKRYVVWTLTGEEEIFKIFNCDWNTVFQLNDDKKLFQLILLHWIEIENRAIAFLDKFNKHNDCFHLHTPKDLNDPDVLLDMFDFFGLELKHKDILLKGRKNKGRKPTIITEDDKKQLNYIVRNLPKKYLKIFKNDPYIKYEWSNLFIVD